MGVSHTLLLFADFIHLHLLYSISLFKFFWRGLVEREASNFLERNWDLYQSHCKLCLIRGVKFKLCITYDNV
jgi:hypothetical protein